MDDFDFKLAMYSSLIAAIAFACFGEWFGSVAMLCILFLQMYIYSILKVAS